MANNAAIKIQAQWRRFLVEKRLSFCCADCGHNAFYTSCYQRDGCIRCFWCHKEHEEDKRVAAMSAWERTLYMEEQRQQERMEEIAAERERCSACADLANAYLCCPDCKHCRHCGDKLKKEFLKKVHGDSEPLYCGSCYYEIMDEMAQQEVCSDCRRGDCYGSCINVAEYRHHCGDDTCEGDCGVLSCGVCIDKHKFFCPFECY